MDAYAFETVDVFTETRFQGNPLAVLSDARGLSPEQMQALTVEFNCSETAFVLPPNDPANTAHIRIFNRRAEMAFAGHPSIGAAFVIARAGAVQGARMLLEVKAGVVEVDLERDNRGEVVGGKIEAPQALSLGPEVPVSTIAGCVGLAPGDVCVSVHKPIVASVGNPYVIAEVSDEALKRSAPDFGAFRNALGERPEFNGRFSLHLYARVGDAIRARMFAPLAGTYEDPATGSANAPLAGLILHHSALNEVQLTITQGVEMGRPSVLRVTARRLGGEIRATVAGRCAPVMRGQVWVNG